MKSIFKKIAFVLALAMVVTMLPAKTASAASSDGPQMYSTLRLYIGGDKTGTYSDANYAKVWNKDGYTVAFESDAEEVATVNAKGYVRAVSVGTANITATFTAANGTTVTKTCVVTVKKNAVAAGLSTASTNLVQEEGIKVGETVQLTAVRKDADGNVVWKDRDVITDGVRFQSSDEEIFTVQKTTGKITGISEGTAQLYVWAVQSEGFDKEANEYQATTEKKEYTVKVVAGEIVAAQSAYNAFILTFPTPEEAKAALTETKKSLTEADAAVSEAENIVKVYKVLTDSENARREVFIGGLAYINGAEGVTSSIEVTMFNELDEKSTYVVSYKGQEMTIETPEYIAGGLEMYGIPIETYEDYSVQEVRAVLYTSGGILLGRNWGDGEDYSCRKYQNWQNSLAVEDTNTSLIHNEYQFDAGNNTTPKVWFYTTDRSFKVTLKGTFEDWENINASGKANVIPATAVISPNDSSIQINSFEACVVSWKTPWYWADWSNKAVASEDEGFYVLVKANITELGSTGDHYSDSYDAGDNFTFVSSNDDKLPINKESGELYPPKDAVNGTVGIHIYYKNKYVGTLPVEIYAKRTFTSFTAQGSLTKMSYSTKNTDVNESIIITLYPKDQLNANFDYSKHGSMDYVIQVTESLQQYFENGGIATYYGHTWDGWPQYELSVKAGADLPPNIVNVRVNCVATFRPYDGSREIVRQYPVSFSLKDTTNSESTNYRLDFNKQSVDMVIETSTNNGVTVNNINDKNVVISAYGYDKDGYKVEKLNLNGAYNVSIKYGSKDVSEDNIGVSGKDVIFKPVITKEKRFAVVSGSSITLDTTTRSAIEKLDEGSYVVALYKGSSNKSLHSMLISLTDSQTPPSMTWKKDTSDKVTVIGAIWDVINVRYNDSNVTVYVGYEKDGNLVFSDDYTLTGQYGQNIYIAKVRYAVAFGNDWYEFEIPVRRTVVYGTNVN